MQYLYDSIRFSDLFVGVALRGHPLDIQEKGAATECRPYKHFSKIYICDSIPALPQIDFERCSLPQVSADQLDKV